MKKMIKISLVTLGVMLFFLNVTLTMNDNKVKLLKVDADFKVATAQYEDCEADYDLECICWGPSYHCVTYGCFNYGCAGVIIE